MKKLTNRKACDLYQGLYKEHDPAKFIKAHCGKQLGYGHSRTVYELKGYPGYVVKIASYDRVECNTLEYIIWREVEYTDKKKWFAEVVWCSANFRVVIQRRVQFRHASQYPWVIPHFFSDLKTTNYGWIDDHFCACDYGGAVITNGFSNKMKTVESWYVPGTELINPALKRKRKS